MCGTRTVLKIAAAISIPFALGFIVFPELRATIAGIAPFALFALCPLSMIIGMLNMKKGAQGGMKSRTIDKP